MKKTFYLLILSFVLLHCENQSKSIDNSDTGNVFGQWLVKGRSWTGKGFLAGEKKETQPIMQKFEKSSWMHMKIWTQTLWLK